MAAGVMITAKRTGRKNAIIGTVSLGGKAAAFLRCAHAHVTILLREDTKCRANGCAEFLRLH